MIKTTFSFVYDRGSADAAFHGIAADRLVLSLLAGIPAEPAWEGCAMAIGHSPLAADTVCVVTTGPGAGELQLRLVEAFERQGVDVVAVYEGGPAGGTPLATANAGRWVEP